MVRQYRTFSNYIASGGTRCALCKIHWFGEVQAHRTSSNLLELQPHRESKVSKLLYDELRVQCVQGANCTGSGRFKHIEPHRTFSNYILTERGRYRDFFYMSSALFDWTEPSLTASLQGLEGVQGALGTSWRRFKHSEPQRNFSNCILTELARYIDFFHTSSIEGVQELVHQLIPCVLVHLSARESALFRRLHVYWLVHSSAQLLGGWSCTGVLLCCRDDTPLSKVWDEDRPSALAGS